MTSMMLAATCRHYVTIYLVLSCFFQTSIRVSAFDDDDETTKSHDHLDHDPSKPLPKDKVLLRDVKTLTFQRNRRTTSRRTHPMHQLACVGGTAGCKLFTPNVSIADIYTYICFVNYNLFPSNQAANPRI